MFRSSPILADAAAVAACFHLFVVLSEEPSLRGRFGPGDDTYCAAVPRWLPRLRRRQPAITS